MEPDLARHVIRPQPESHFGTFRTSNLKSKLRPQLKIYTITTFRQLLITHYQTPANCHHGYYVSESRALHLQAAVAGQHAQARRQLVHQRRRLPPARSSVRQSTQLRRQTRGGRGGIANMSICRADDLIVEEDENVLKALKRLPPKEAYDRVYRLRRAFQCSATHKLLPKSEWTKQEEVRCYHMLPSIH